MLAIIGALAVACGPAATVKPVADAKTIERELAKGERGDLLRDLGWVHLLDGEVDKARRELQRAAELAPRDPRALLGVAALAHVEGRYAEARDAWAKVLEQVDPKDPWARAVEETAAGSLETLVGEAPEERAFAARLERIDAAKLLSPLSARRLQVVRAHYARRRGDEAAAAAMDRVRCPAAWRVSGPWGHLPRLDLAKPLPPELSQPLVGKLAPTRACAFSVEMPRPGVAHATTWVNASRAATTTVTVDSGEPWLLVVDRKTVFESSERDRYPARVRRVAMPLAAGWHEVTLRVAAPHAPLELAASIAGDAPLAFGDHRPERLASPPERAEPVAVAFPPHPGGRMDAVADFLAGYAAMRDADGDAGEAAVEKLLAEAPRFPLGHLLAAQVAAEDSSRPARIARDRARRSLERALELDPQAERARVNLAAMDLQDDHAEKSLRRLGEGGGWRASYGRYQAYRARGWLPEAERALADARAKNPEACQPLEASVGLALERRDVAGARRFAVEVVKCDPGADQLAELEVQHGDPRAAVAEYRRLLAIDPSREAWRSGLARAQAAAGDAAGAVVTLSALVADHPRTSNYRVRLADALVARGGADAQAKAREALTAGLAETPEAQELHRALGALGDGNVMDPYRVDGKAVIATFEQSGHRYDSPSVIVLDRTVTRVFPTGARLTLTHNIIRVQTKDGIDKWGEVTIPEGADVLLLRTVKADGTTREPEEIAEKQSVSVPDLEPGDYVEFEYVDPSAPPSAFPNGFLAERFYFQSFDAPLDRTEYLLVTPKGMPLQIDRRGDAPALHLEARGDLELRTWSDKQKPQLQPEPQQAPFTESVPSVRAASGLSALAWRDFLRDGSFFVLRKNRELAALAAQLRTPQAIDAWVRAHVKGGGSLDEAATAVLARGEGNRITLERALLAALGLPSEVWLVRARNEAVLDGPLPDLEGFDEPVMAVGADLVVDPRFRHAPSGFVAPLLRGQPALVLDGAPEARFAKVPQGLGDQREIAMEATVADDGSAEVKVRETLRGWPALEWREGIDRIPADRLRPQFEQATLGFFFPGASLDKLTFGPKDEDAAPFVVEYSFYAPHFALPEGRHLVVPAPFPALLGKRFVGVGRRTTPMQLTYAAPTRLTATLKLPAGTKVSPSKVSLGDPLFGSFAQTVTVEPGGARLTCDFMMPPSRVPPPRYQDLADYARAVDSAELHAIDVTLP